MGKPLIVVLGAGLGGTIASYEIKDAVKGRAEVMTVSDTDTYSFIPSNPWVAVGWREPEAIQVHLPPVFAKKKIGFTSVGAKRVHASEKRLELNDGTSITYDYLVIATGPDLAFNEIEGLGPQGHTVSVCQTAHAADAADAFDAFVENPGPIVVGAVQGASCYGPAYEFALILDTELRRRKIRDKVPMTFVPPNPISDISASMASATPRACSKASCATVISNGSPMRASPASRPAWRMSRKSPRTAASRPSTICPSAIRCCCPPFAASMPSSASKD